MAGRINWGSAESIPPGMYAKAGKDQSGDWHILMGASQQSIEIDGRGHDHYWKTDGKWYVQVKLSPDAGAAPYRPGGKHLFEDGREFRECPDSNLDNLLRQLQ